MDLHHCCKLQQKPCSTKDHRSARLSLHASFARPDRKKLLTLDKAPYPDRWRILKRTFRLPVGIEYCSERCVEKETLPKRSLELETCRSHSCILKFVGENMELYKGLVGPTYPTNH